MRDYDFYCSKIKDIFSSVLNRSCIDPSDSLRSLGGDSISFVFILSAISEEVGVTPELTELSPLMTIKEIAIWLQGHKELIASQSDEVSGYGSELFVPSLPNRFSYFMKMKRNFMEWTVSTPVLVPSSNMSIAGLEDCYRAVVADSDSLRISVLFDADSFKQIILPVSDSVSILHVDIPSLVGDQNKIDFLESSVRSVERSFLPGGPLSRLVIYRESSGGGDFYFCVIAHHICVDAIGFGLLVKDLVNRLKLDVGISHSKPSLYADYANAYLSYNEFNALQEIDYWRSLPWSRWSPMLGIDLLDSPVNIEKYTIQVSGSIGIPSNVLVDHSNDLPACIISAAAKSFYRWTSKTVFYIDMLFHGREHFMGAKNLGTMVAWLSEVRPVVVSCSEALDSIVVDVDSQIEKLGSIGSSYGYLRYVKRMPQFTSLPNAEFSLNFLSKSLPKRDYYDMCCPLWERPSVSAPLPDTQRAFLISGGCWVEGDRLVLSWDFSSKLFDPKSVEGFNRNCLELIGELFNSYTVPR